MITHGKLVKMIRYDAETGIINWIGSRAKWRNGTEAGSKHTEGYRIVSIDSVRYLSHRLAFFYMTGEWPKNQVDHINHIRSDNRWVNLKEVTNQENHKNETLSKNSTTGFTGVTVNKRNGRYRAHIKVDYKQLWLGEYIELLDAVTARKKANIKYNFNVNHGLP